MATSKSKGSGGADIRSAVYPEMGSYKGRGQGTNPPARHMKWGSGRVTRKGR